MIRIYHFWNGLDIRGWSANPEYAVRVQDLRWEWLPYSCRMDSHRSNIVFFSSLVSPFSYASHTNSVIEGVEFQPIGSHPMVYLLSFKFGCSCHSIFTSTMYIYLIVVGNHAFRQHHGSNKSFAKKLQRDCQLLADFVASRWWDGRRWWLQALSWIWWHSVTWCQACN